MRVPVKLLGFVFWVFCLNFAQSQVCSRASIPHTNTEPVVKESYNDGETVELSCMTGFTGMYRLKCEKGEWKTFIAEPCAKKKCSHPGDTANGDFILYGSEFVFGATVVYTCNKGFEMTSRFNQRTCRSQGWDNTLPICEAVTCPAIHIDGDMTALGNTEEGSYGDVIHFECVSNDTKIDGSSDIHCTETGDWSHSVPKCKEITCTAPDISNGYVVEKMPEYQKDAILKYRCSPGFKPREGIPRCAKFGWTLNPECDVTCQLDVTESGAVRTIPEGKTMFKAGETVRIFCSVKKLSFYNQETFTCTNNGKWDYKPTCEEKICQVPHNQHVYLPTFYFRGDLNLNVKKRYSCESGYREIAEEATCARDGWTPKPLCAEIMCDPPKIPNAEIVGGQKQKYKISSRIEYKCRPGSEQEELVQITCDSEGQWTGIQTCTDGTCQEQELKNVEILFGHPGITSPFNPGHILVFRCTNVNMRFYGQRAIECQPDGRWNYPYPQCGGTVECSQPTRNLRFVKLSDEKTVFSNFEILRYTCNTPYDEISGGALMCQNGKWNGTFVCKSGICPPPPYLQHGDYSIISTEKDVITEVSYTCQSYYVQDKQQESYKCVEGKWETPPKCLGPCEINDIVEKYNLQLPTEKVYIKHADKYRLNCRAGWNTGSEMGTYVDVSCSKGNLQIDKSCDTQNN